MIYSSVTHQLLISYSSDLFTKNEFQSFNSFLTKFYKSCFFICYYFFFRQKQSGWGKLGIRFSWNQMIKPRTFKELDGTLQISNFHLWAILTCQMIMQQVLIFFWEFSLPSHLFGSYEYIKPLLFYIHFRPFLQMSLIKLTV